MISEATLARAIDEGILTAVQAESLRALEHAAAPPPPVDAWSASQPPSPDDESLRFITGFSDFFVAIGLVLFLGAAGFFLFHFFGMTAMFGGLAVLAWALAEFFTRVRRMALPSIILLALFVVCVFAAVTQTMSDWSPFKALSFAKPGRDHVLSAISLAGLAAAAGAGLHYWRFHVPITVAAGAAALSATFLGVAASLWPGISLWAFEGLVLLCGIGIFALAMRFDSSDPERITRRTDIAFWLHLLAAPLIVHPVISVFVGKGAHVESSAAIAILCVFLIFALVAIVIDRRAMLVSGLTYAGLAFGSLFKQTGLTDFTLPATLLALGSFVLLLSAGWQPLRRLVLRLFPAAILRRLPHPVRGAP
jgi:hypothetical protein